ncbi:DUF262 domain-containing protein [Lactobacillus delbrueckii subsp. lactis]|uniref:DUF262 domain-containing protein n=1 Tax=Lactobacillus delbrueckii TaxID=1584 RepID=UPI001E3953A1|nr:DUF262 domain-containing protein [Lactobacillus delbrueckii]MCD5530330.1 DUF262 domain-containing protein [Lactobacillus delbrueckii subsp. lactis]
MKGEARPIYKMFDRSDTKLQIPVYQRNYDWKVANCQQLFNDLVDMAQEGRKNRTKRPTLDFSKKKFSSKESVPTTYGMQFSD